MRSARLLLPLLTLAILAIGCQTPYSRSLKGQDASAAESAAFLRGGPNGHK